MSCHVTSTDSRRDQEDGNKIYHRNMSKSKIFSWTASRKKNLKKKKFKNSAFRYLWNGGEGREVIFSNTVLTTFPSLAQDSKRKMADGRYVDAVDHLCFFFFQGPHTV